MGQDNFILVVDDDSDIHYCLRVFFRKSGIKTIHSETLNDAKNKIITQPLYIFLDNQLPDGRGIDFIPQIKATAPDSVIVIMTGYMPAKSKLEALDKGADYFIEKPFSFDQIKSLFNEVLQN